MELSHYGMSPERGFLSPFEIDEITLPGEFDTIVEAAGMLTRLDAPLAPRL